MMITVGDWELLPGGQGARLAVAGDYTVAAQLGLLTVWRGRQRIAQVTAGTPAPGWPRLVDDQVCWGASVVDLTSGQLTTLSELAAATTGEMLPAGVGRELRPAAYGWSTDGAAVAVSVQGVSGTAHVELRDRGGQVLAALWEASDLAPRTVWTGRTLIAVGSRRPHVFDHSGAVLAELAAETPPIRIEADRTETSLLVVEHHRITRWDVATWTPRGTAEGQWLDAMLTPDGRAAVAVDFSGNVWPMDASLKPDAVLPTPEPADAVALGDTRIALAGPDGVYTAPLSWD